MIFLFFKTSDHKKPYKINTFGEKNQTDCDNQSGRKNTVPMPVIKEVLDHSDMKTTMRYVHTADSQILSALNQLNSYNEDLIQND